ncbi:hypothetical protein KI387_008029 [Taxus chinensis]|uniref:DUF4283 domain-containing protein n=1 Tax=Taxus chinensis TaxID=29808 RepID=A0AA38FIF9_TAXCH|nr:hypothetical protein KI387_008029 [Taxus chinensis]
MENAKKLASSASGGEPSFRDALRSPSTSNTSNRNFQKLPLRMPIFNHRKNEKGCLRATNGVPVIQLKKEDVQDNTHELENHGLIIRFLGFRPPLPSLKEWAKKTWQTKGEFTLSVCPNGYFLVVFTSATDREYVFQGGPWFLGRAAKISLEIETEKWEQMVDYENIPFRCRICREYGDLVKDCIANMPVSKEGEKTKDEFITPKKKQVIKKFEKEQAGISNSNRYASLQEENEEEKVEDMMESQVPETQLDKPTTTAVILQSMDIQNQMVVFQANPNNDKAQPGLKSYQRKPSSMRSFRNSIKTQKKWRIWKML